MQIYIVINPDGLNIRTQPNEKVRYNIKRRMSAGEKFTAYDVFLSQSGLEVWAQLSTIPRQPEYCMIASARTTFAKPAGTEIEPESWKEEIDAWARTQGYTGARP